MRSSDSGFAIRVNRARLSDYVAINQLVTIVGKVIMVGTWNGYPVTEMVVHASDGVNVLIEDIPVSATVCERQLLKEYHILCWRSSMIWKHQSEVITQ
jgi:hypothetical protein